MLLILFYERKLDVWKGDILRLFKIVGFRILVIRFWGFGFFLVGFEEILWI